ncbi:MAG: hypothetical protein JW910_23095 [Anaerolineae bacterium]|nr:hypothetical protein [Anaerolineae bacterium]
MSEALATLEGRFSIQAALTAESRDFEAIYLDDTRPDRRGHLAQLIQRAESRGVRVERVGPDVIDGYASGTSHGGIIARVGPRKTVDLGDLLPPEGPAFIVMIDGVEDPFNFGQSVRALYAAGADGLVLPPRNWLSAADIVARASAGASERIPTAVVESAPVAAQFFRSRGLAVACTDDKGATPLYAADLTGPLFLLIGGERRGITRSFVRQADLVLGVPYGRKFGASLGTAAAAAVVAFEVLRQRGTER